jgi:hypothetical protein
MAKISGIGLTISVTTSAGGVVPIGPDVNSCTINTSRGEQDVTGLDKSAIERLLLLGDSELGLSGVYNPALSHTVFHNIGTQEAAHVGRDVVIVLPGGGLATMTCIMVFTNYILSRGADGSLTWTVTGKLADGSVPTFS